MSDVQKIVVAAGQTEATVRLHKSAQHIIIRRTSTLAIMLVGLAAGLPETLTAEISHPVRETAEMFDRMPLSIPAIWAQYGRGPIAEQALTTGPANPLFGSAAGLSLEPNMQIVVDVCIFLNDLGPIELLSDDQFNITIKGLLAGATYEISAPEMPILPAYANQYYKYEQSLILENDRDRQIFLKGIDGLVLPNVGDDVITRLKINWIVDADLGTTREEELTMHELITSQESANPAFNSVHYRGGKMADIDTDFSPSRFADYPLIDTKSMISLTVYKTLGKLITYTTVKVADRA